MNEILVAKKISKTYGGVRVLNGVNFTLKEGEVHALVGENGAGKSTLIKAIAGVIQPDPGGEIIYNGEHIAHMTATRSRQLGISVIYQDICLFPNLSVAENIFSGLKQHGFHSRKKMRETAQKTIRRMGLNLDPDTTLGEISVGQQQLVAIARAITFNARVIVMDEPTASLSSSEVEMLYALIRSIKERGVGIIYISHKFDEIFAIADRISVLRDGSLVACGNREEFDQHQLIKLMVGRELHFIPYHNTQGIGETRFEVKGLTCEPYFRNVSFSVREREILGITGLVGAGRSEVAQTVFGLLKPQRGEIILRGKPIHVKNVREAIGLGICYLPEDRRVQGLFMPLSMRVNTTTANIREVLNKFGLISPRAEQETADSYISSLDIRPANAELSVGSFSGGNQQKVLVARWLNAKPKLLIVDEVTSGVDVGVKTEIHKLLRELADSGVTVIIISSDLPEILAISDRIVVMAQGRVTTIMNVDDATQESVMEKSIMTEEE